MEYVLQNTDIFDEEIGIKFNKAIIANKDDFIKENVYKFTLSFHENLLNDTRFEEFNIPVPSKKNKGTRKDKIYDVMSYQLKRMEQILIFKSVIRNSFSIKRVCKNKTFKGVFYI